jgi:D-alanine-D-alanine ligase
LRITVLYGGTSVERDVSLVSGRSVGLALEDRGHDVLLVDPLNGGEAVAPSEATPSGIGGEPPVIRREAGGAIRAAGSPAVREADVVFVMLHGGTGEDGTVQGLLELAGKPYTGSGVLACALAMDKRASKILFEMAGVPTPPWRVLSSEARRPPEARGGSPSLPEDRDLDGAPDVVDALGGFPLIVKPNDQGSTVGLTLVRDERALGPAVDIAARYSRQVLVEAFVPGRELTVTVLGGEALPVVEIAPMGGLYDYESKYGSGMSEYTCPALLSDEETESLKDHALAAFAALGCRGYARVDFRLTPEHDPYCLEVNTVPGMTELSLVPMAAAADGITFGELVERIAFMALEREERVSR